MKTRSGSVGTWIGVALVLAAVCLTYLVWTGKILGGKPVCEVCGRELHPDNVLVALDANGKRKQTCCPRCGIHFILNHGGRVLSATDFNTGKPLSAETAIYLEGSDIMQCCSTSGFRESQGGYNDVAYDRCMPSLIAFSGKDEAEKVRRDHGGEIITFDQAKQSVARQISGK
jgi:hypothetical protein